jgi:hypothetical protein
MSLVAESGDLSVKRRWICSMEMEVWEVLVGTRMRVVVEYGRRGTGCGREWESLGFTELGGTAWMGEIGSASEGGVDGCSGTKERDRPRSAGVGGEVNGRRMVGKRA